MGRSVMERSIEGAVSSISNRLQKKTQTVFHCICRTMSTHRYGFGNMNMQTRQAQVVNEVIVAVS